MCSPADSTDHRNATVHHHLRAQMTSTEQRLRALSQWGEAGEKITCERWREPTSYE